MSTDETREQIADLNRKLKNLQTKWERHSYGVAEKELADLKHSLELSIALRKNRDVTIVDLKAELRCSGGYHNQNQDHACSARYKGTSEIDPKAQKIKELEEEVKDFKKYLDASYKDTQYFEAAVKELEAKVKELEAENKRLLDKLQLTRDELNQADQDTNANVSIVNGQQAKIRELEARNNTLATDYASAGNKITELEKEVEILAWNLGGCSTYAFGYDLDVEPDKDMARSALLDVRKRIKELEYKVKYLKEDNKRIGELADECEPTTHKGEPLATHKEIIKELKAKVKKSGQAYMRLAKHKAGLQANLDKALKALKIMDNRGGLGLDVHEWLRSVIRDIKEKD